MKTKMKKRERKSKYTTIRVSRKLRDQLAQIAKKDEQFEDVIKKLMKEAKR